MWAVVLLSPLLALASDVYDKDPANPWNAMHDALVAHAGAENPDEIDTFVFAAYGLDGARQVDRDDALGRALDAFLATDPVHDCDAIRRAWLQRDLWATFDRVYAQQPDPALLERLARAMRRIALTKEQIAALPAGTPAEFDASKFVTLADAAGFEVLTPAHAWKSAGRSAFEVALRLPAGRDATLAYVEKLGAFAEPVRFDANGRSGPGFYLSHDVPQFPAGTELALVRRALLLDPSGAPMASPLLETIQVRAYVEGVESLMPTNNPDRKILPGTSMWVATPRRTFAGSGLQKLGGDDRIVHMAGDLLGGGHHIDALKSCWSCHGSQGVYSFTVWRGGGAQCGDAFTFPAQSMPRRLHEAKEWDRDGRPARNKTQRADYGALRVLWGR